MRRLFMVFIMLLSLSAATFAQQSVPVNTALQAALDDINERLGTEYTWEDGDVAFLYEETRVEGDNLGCPVVAKTNNNSYEVTVIQYDLELDNIYEWEYRFAYNGDGVLFMVLCDTPPGGTRGPGFNSTPLPTSTPTPTDTPTPTPTVTPTPPPVLIGRDGPRVLPPLICAGLPTRLIVDSTGRVMTGKLSNNLRQSPNIDAAFVGDLMQGAEFTVVDGPFCNDDIAWYAVAHNGELLGWTAEGERGDYYLEPVLTDAARILPANASLLAPAGVPFAAGTLGMTQPHAGGFVAYDVNSAQLYVLPADIFTTLAASQWQPLGSEIIGQFSFAHRDFLGRIWTADALNGTLMPANEPRIAPFAMAPSTAPVVAIDTELWFIAVGNPAPNGVTIHSVDHNGGGTVEMATFGMSAAVRDVIFRPDESGLYVATDTEVALFTYGPNVWNPTPVTIFAHDLLNPKLSVSLGGGTVALTGMRLDGIPGLRVFNVNVVGGISVTQGAAINGEPGTSWSRPSLNPDGSLVAYSSTLGKTRVIDTAAGVLLAELSTGAFGPVAFSTDGLELFAPTLNQQIQAYGVPLVLPATATPTISPVVVVTATPGVIVVTATATFVPPVVVVTATPGVIVVTATPTTAPTLAVPPTAQPTP